MAKPAETGYVDCIALVLDSMTIALFLIFHSGASINLTCTEHSYSFF